MQCVKHSISLPRPLSRFLNKRAQRVAKERGLSEPNVSAVLAELVIKARNEELEKAREDVAKITEAETTE